MANNQMKIKVLDLYCGAGGLSLGFKREGFEVIGIDNNPWATDVFKVNRIGGLQRMDLSKETAHVDCDIITGGPPCRPWSSVNVCKRGEKHPDYNLVRRFFDHVIEMQPKAFLLENVPPLASDPVYAELIEKVRREGYSVANGNELYSDHGSTMRRRRLITAGFRDFGADASAFFRFLEAKKCNTPPTVREVIEKYEKYGRGDFRDHEWPELRTIEKYTNRYKTGKYGWFRLDYDKQSPSFGNIMKTYILHPMAGQNGVPLRVISVREAMEIMGFPSDFVFPAEMGLSMRYQMVADAVSPSVSEKFARVMKVL
ncbi:MAG TPA: DNA cytosine methyltransferase, partial [Candidatus Methanoperedens sp.]